MDSAPPAIGSQGGARRGARLTALLPRSGDYAGLAESWRTDVAAGLTVGVVALPLALAFGVATGLGAASGLVTAVVAGLVAAVFGGSDVQVSGPTGAMTVVLVPVVHRFGADAVLVMSLMAGVMVVAAGVAGFGRYLAYVPWPVVEGFTLGIAVIIFLQQVPSALGVATPEGENTAVVAATAIGDAVVGARSRVWAVLLVTLVAGVMVGLPRWSRAVPASLIAVIAATTLSSAAGLSVPTIGELPSSLPLPSLPAIPWGSVPELFPAAFAVAVLAALESLLSAQVADGMADGRRHDPDRELVGQGLANLASPLFGGMPATGAIARTAVNVRSGARTRVAAMAHAVVLVGVIYAASGVVGRIPLAALAGVLMVTAVRMVERHAVRAVLTATRSDAVVFVITAVATVAFDLVVAVEIGIGAAAVLALRGVARSSSVIAEESAPLPAAFSRPVSMTRPTETVTVGQGESLLAQRIVVYRLDGALFFGAAQRFLTELTAVSDVAVAVLRLPGLAFLDATGAKALGEIIDELEDRGVTVLVKGLRPEHRRALEAVGVFERLSARGHLFDSLDDSIAHARLHIDDPTACVAVLAPPTRLEIHGRPTR